MVRRTLWIPLLGWWSHIVIDVFTHSADYYAVPVLYPFTERGFDGIAWITPWFMVQLHGTGGCGRLVADDAQAAEVAAEPTPAPHRSSTLALRAASTHPVCALKS
jgi:membrane-bound metal-dependent hydrolase YbcI (DUF457 family)